MAPLLASDPRMNNLVLFTRVVKHDLSAGSTMMGRLGHESVKYE
jgi:hypothetical protein